jgi:hypothetical protein
MTVEDALVRIATKMWHSGEQYKPTTFVIWNGRVNVCVSIPSLPGDDPAVHYSLYVTPDGVEVAEDHGERGD